MRTSLPPAGSLSPNTESIRMSNRTWSLKTLVSTTLLATLALLPQVANAQITCQQFGSDTFRVGSTVKYFWTGADGTPSFNIDLYCYENNKYMKTVTTIDTTLVGGAGNYSWVVDQSITNNLAQCQFNQYQGRYTWNTTDADTGISTPGSAICKTMLLVGPGVVTAPNQPGAPLDPNAPTIPEDDQPAGDIEITDKTKNIIIGVGCAVGALVLAGFAGFYYIRFKNKRAVEKSASRKLREPLQPDQSRPGMGPGASASHARYNELGSVTTSVAGYSPMQRPGEMVELGGMPPAPSSSGASSSSRPQSFDYRSGSPTPIASRHQAANSSGLLAQPSGSFISDRPPSLLTSSFTPAGEDPNPFQSRPSGRAPAPPGSRAHDHDDEERQMYELQQQQHQQQHQQQIQQEQMHQQQLQQQNYAGYQY
ncbi:hypothetical protein BGZ96_010238 [Linnemannia gamsii]|uniref:Uncharacterized protein n=1 Tax=Linnemannia gamsii TaxID=64522 RepID=A0ABQ7KDU9_9FUNG|nr:hypothetical protein BGZ96_010238 [Linnemannia gamsii]